MTGRIFKWGEKRQDGNATLMDGVTKDGRYCHVQIADGEHRFTLKTGGKDFKLTLMPRKPETSERDYEAAIGRLERAMEKTLMMLDLYGSTDREVFGPKCQAENTETYIRRLMEWDNRMEWK